MDRTKVIAQRVVFRGKESVPQKVFAGGVYSKSYCKHSKFFSRWNMFKALPPKFLEPMNKPQVKVVSATRPYFFFYFEGN